jgi:adenylate kinase
MIVTLFGPPGSGKGTQAKKLSAESGWPHLSTGDMLRSAIAAKTKVGLEAKAFIDEGALVPDKTVIHLIADRIRQPDCQAGFILDGFPRNVAQAEALDRMLSEHGLQVNLAVLFEISQDELVKRLSGRRTCVACGTMYHLETAPSKHPGICDACGKALIQRTDDQPEVIKKRLSVYEQETAPLIGFYRQQQKLKSIDATQAPVQVNYQLRSALNMVQVS